MQARTGCAILPAMADSISAAAAATPPYFAKLNPTQREAVEALDGPVLVLAGAGTGKTRVLTTRLAHLLYTRRCLPGELLAVTFTNKAAREMKDRVSSLLGVDHVESWWLGTFHALAARILRKHAERLGLASNFTIIDTDDQIRLVKQLLRAEQIDDKKWPARAVLSAIERWKDKGLTPDRLKTTDGGEMAAGRAVEIFRQYQERLITLNACDFGDLLLHCLTLFQKHPDVLEEYHRRFKYILVDEYQDTNVAQYLWLRLLAQANHNICCVGDDDQSIYGWRGAEVGNILRFEQDFTGAKLVRLERNYRSTGNILGAASGLIKQNAGRLGKTLWTEGGEGEKVRVRGLWDGEAEARYVGDEIEALQRKGHSLDEIAILVRTTAQTREFEERFITLGLPYRVVGGPRFYERAEIRDALAYLRLLQSPSDDLAFERIVNKPKRGLGDATIRLLHGLARPAEIPLTEAARRIVETDELRPQARRSLGGLLADLDRWTGMVGDTPHPELAEIVLDESGYTEMWQLDKSVDAPGRLENLKELVNAMAEFDSLMQFLEHVSLVMENTQTLDQEQVTLMTLHGAKGLEFDSVFLPGWEEGLFPNQRALDETGLRGLEEERRLAYVGLTRARKRVVISFVANRRLHGSWAAALPSRFLDELPKDHVEVESDAGLYGSRGGGYGGFSGFAGFSDWGQGRTTPGYRRAQSHARGAAPKRFIDGVAEEVGQLSKPGFKVGQRVFHQKFGYGVVIEREGDRLSISFDKAGDKKVMASFVVPEDQAG
ncbi:DNA helicase-2/ATP-dependent DNA helicase PcrA [Limibacillus halophilus]|uniref:DNA 3'-5' helicase n=2 Tax=Limibacillus halophilus TaxID=1579333 RepID=A0A839SQU8_9PROT|nr:DNA helicase-2/ATP-dependent DNA helicase PcrA [Limibacillus halophilus]